MADPWLDVFNETDAVSITVEAQVIDLIAVMEEALPWYDHVACAFLLYPDAGLAAERIESLLQVKHQPKETWKNSILSQLVSTETTNENYEALWLQLVESLHILNYRKLIEVRSLSYPISAGSIDSFRLELFTMIDDMPKDKAADLVIDLNAKLQHKITFRDDWPIELYLLRWIQQNDISRENWGTMKDKLKESWKFPNRPNTETVENQQDPAVTGKLKTFTQHPEIRKFTVQSGLCVIINQMNFFVDYQLPGELLRLARPGLLFRYGSDTDRDSLSEVFKMLGFEVKMYENLTFQAMRNTLESIAKIDFKRYDALVVCLLSHGDRNVIYSTDSIPMPLDLIKQYFDGVKCPSLANKPKMFFMQACQGIRDAPVAELEHDGRLPAYANFFEAWATVPGFLSYRSTIAGGIFVQNLRWALQHHGHKIGLFDLMAYVNARVGVEEVTRLGNRQISCYTSSLTGTVEFKRDKESMVAAIVDNIERQMFNATTVLTVKMISTTPKVARWLLETWGY